MTADPATPLRECHHRIRLYCAGLQRMMALPDLSDPRVPRSAAQAARYFGEGLRLHAADEDHSYAPRLRAAVPGAAALLDGLAADHAQAEADLAALLPQLERLAAGEVLARDPFVAAAGPFCEGLLTHITAEEDALFPLLLQLSPADLLAIDGERAARRRASPEAPARWSPA